MDPNLFRYIWKNSRREQISILFLIVASLPFYWLSLEIPKRIVNEALGGQAFLDGRTEAKLLEVSISLPSFLGGYTFNIFNGIAFDQVGYLLALSFMFLSFVLVNGAFKYKINIDKGILAERLLRRMRFDLFSRMMRFRPEDIRAVKPAEAATMINNEVEPIGAFTGDAFVWPVFLSTQALTALIFILAQSFWLGGVAFGIVLVQAFVIPALRRKQLEYARQRQIAARKLSGRIGEMVDSAPLIYGHGIVPYTQAEIGQRLGQLFNIRVALYKRKYAVKYLNMLLSQVTPFFFYSIGGYFALTGSLDIGQLVAVIAAYKDLPPPIKELIDWDQRRADTAIKYQQVLSQFPAEKLLPLEEDAAEEISIPPDAPLQINGVRVVDQRGNPKLESLSVTIARPSHIALVGPNGSAREVFSGILGRQITDFEGKIRIGTVDFSALNPTIAARFMAYAPPDAILFSGALRDNIEISLQRHLPSETETETEQTKKDRAEAIRTGNPAATLNSDWRDFEEAGVDGPEALEKAAIRALQIAGLDADIYNFGFLGRLRPDTDEATLEAIVRARSVVRQKLSDQDMLNLIEPFEPTHYNKNATIGENLVFGLPSGSHLAGRNLATDPLLRATLSADPYFRAILSAEALEQPLVEIGLQIAQTTIETFAELPPGHPLFERYGLIQSSELDEYIEVLERAKSRDFQHRLSHDDHNRLIALALAYVEPQHRLNLVKPDLQSRILRARKSFNRYLPGNYAIEIEFYKPDKVMMAAPIRDNLLFGRIAYGVANSERKVSGVLKQTLDELNLTEMVYQLGLDYDVGPGGKLLFAPQRTAVSIARCLIRRPGILIIDGGLSDFSSRDAALIIQNLRKEMDGRTLIMSFTNPEMAKGFDQVIRFEGIRAVDFGSNGLPARTGESADASSGQGKSPDQDSLNGTSIREITTFEDVDNEKSLAKTAESSQA